MDDETGSLTQGLACCDEHAWRVFHDRFYQQLHHLALARGVADCDAPEIVQGVYLRVLRHVRIIRDAGSFNAWLACLVRCEVIDAARRKGRRSWLNERFQHWQEARRTTVEEHLAEQLEEVMLVLDEHERELIRGHYLDGWSQEALAAHHQLSVKAVESKLARLRKRIRQSLEKPSTHLT